MKIKATASSFAFIFILSLFFSNCRKDQDNGVPIAPVDIYIYTSDPAFINLNAIGGWVYITGGVRGILVYRKSSSEFMAYERNCTYQSDNICATVYVDNSNIIAEDTCCNSKFSMIDGSVIQTPATFPLRTYNTTFDGSTLHIYN
jgi:nitrite reductase/ring-hydroxylating ferredoxin subunit